MCVEKRSASQTVQRRAICLFAFLFVFMFGDVCLSLSFVSYFACLFVSCLSFFQLVEFHEGGVHPMWRCRGAFDFPALPDLQPDRH